METITLECSSPDGKRVFAQFAPEKGMNLLSYRLEQLEVIDPSTRSLFDERAAGLGALIGPHFHHRPERAIPVIKDETLFPHIAGLRSKGIKEPFSHGIARYAPWRVLSSTTNSIIAEISGKDTWNGVVLSDLEGQNFTMQMKASLLNDGLHLKLSIVSETSSLVGIHYYYMLPNGKGKVTAQVRDQVRINRKLQPIPKDWHFDSNHTLTFDLSQEADFTFRPYPDSLKGIILLETESYSLKTNYSCVCEENCWQLYHPQGASFVCIEPISSQDPSHPNLTVSGLEIHLEIAPRNEKDIS